MKSLFNWRVLLNLVIAIGVFVGGVYLVFNWLKVYTNHGKEVAVPNVVNHSMHQAIQSLDEIGLEYEVDSAQYDPKYKPFQVLGVFPRPGSKVKEGRTITLKVNPRTWAKVTVPEILDKYKGLAFRRLAQVGLKVGDTLYEPNIQRDAVIRLLHNGNEIKPGVQLPRFSVIDLVIGMGPKRDIPVPNLVGLSIGEAKLIVQQNLFEIGLLDYEGGQADDNAIIYFQDPAPGSFRDQGMQIDLWASKKPISALQGKIEELNSIYRVKIFDTAPVNSYDELPAYPSPNFDEEGEGVLPPVPSGETRTTETKSETKPKVEAKPKTDTKSSTERSQLKSESNKPTAAKPSSGNATSKPKGEPQKPAEKPKAKVVIE